MPHTKSLPLIPDGDPRAAEHDQIFVSMLGAMLQRAVADYGWQDISGGIG